MEFSSFKQNYIQFIHFHHYKIPFPVLFNIFTQFPNKFFLFRQNLTNEIILQYCFSILKPLCDTFVTNNSSAHLQHFTLMKITE